MLPEPILEKIHPAARDQFNFAGAVYVRALSPITGILCPTHGEFRQYIGQLKKESGAWCPACGNAKRTESSRMGFSEFVSRCASTHAGKYEYPSQTFLRINDVIRVVCPLHGEFSIKGAKHLYAAQGCPTCGASTRGHRKNVQESARLAADAKIARARELFPERAAAVHRGKYVYDTTEYITARGKVTIMCPVHGEFSVGAYDHLAGAGCQKCSHHESAGESAVAALLAKHTPIDQRNRTLLKPRELDIYLPEKQLAIEYCGEFWHSHKDAAAEKQDKHKHFQKYADCKALGIRLITLYESEWLEHNYAVRRLLRNAVGKSKGKLMARKCELRKVTTTEARPFYDRYHPQGGAGSGEHYALFWKGKMVACMRFVLGANDRGAGAANRVWTLGRYATRVTVAGAASRLFKAFLEEHNPPEVKSFSDNRFFDGGMYAQLGFVLEANVAPDYQVWHPKLGLRPKSHFQRRLLPTRIADVGADIVFDPESDPRTEAEITYALGARRLYDCGKKRWVWTPQA